MAMSNLRTTIEDLRQFSDIENDRLEWSHVGSMFNIWSELRMREEFKAVIPSKQSFKTDIFVWGRGDIGSRSSTVIGGIPFGSKPVEEQFRYVGRIYLGDSFDILDSRLNCDTLSIWGCSDFPYGKVKGILENSDELRPLTNSLVTQLESVDPFVGSIFRTEDLTCTPKLREDPISVESEFGVRYYRPGPWRATKIGGLDPFGNSRDSIFLCTLFSIQAEPEMKYPWINSSEPLPLSNIEGNGYTAKGNSLEIGDLGGISFYLSNNGSIESILSP